MGRRGRRVPKLVLIRISSFSDNVPLATIVGHNLGLGRGIRFFTSGEVALAASGASAG